MGNPVYGGASAGTPTLLLFRPDPHPPTSESTPRLHSVTGWGAHCAVWMQSKNDYPLFLEEEQSKEQGYWQNTGCEEIATTMECEDRRVTRRLNTEYGGFDASQSGIWGGGGGARFA